MFGVRERREKVDKDVQIEVQGERKIGYDFLNFFRYVKFRK